MYLTKMRPGQLKDFITRNIPVILSAGSIEYHGPHLPIGTDFLIADSIVEMIEKRIPNGCIIAPPLPFSSTMNWAGTIEEGDVDFSPDALYIYAHEILTQLTAIGFKRIYILQHHQGPEGLPCLSLRRAAADVIRNITKQWGSSWGRVMPDKNPNPGIFELIKIAYADSFTDNPGEMPVGHGGKGETQLIMAAYPETVNMEELSVLLETPEWLKDAGHASKHEGEGWLESCATGWIRELERKYIY